MNLNDAERILKAEDRVILDWYDGMVQAILMDPISGCWFAFATHLGPTSRRYCVVRLSDHTALERARRASFASDDDLLEFGKAVLANGRPLDRYRIVVVNDSVVEVAILTPEDALPLEPQCVSDLFRERLG